jgi:hypothetical protein
MAYLVSYDLRKPRRNYKGLLEELERSPGWWHYLDSTWLIVTSENADQLYRRLKIHIDESDSLLIIQVSGDYQGWLPKEAWTWIGKHV